MSRALALIEAGGLDDGDVDGLADRLGVGERQLRRLFRQHLGASPVAVAQTRRVLLAKQLIHETTLPMAEVALAVGLRQRAPLQRDLPATVRPPAGDAAADPRQDAGARPARCRCGWPTGRPTTGTRCWRSWRARAIPGVEIVAGDIYRRTHRDRRDSGVISVAPADKNRVDVAIRFPDIAALPPIIARVRRVFDLAADPDRIGAHLSLGPGAGAAGRRAAGPARARRLGRLRAGGARDPRPADHRGRRDQLAGKLVQAHGAPLPATCRRSRGLSHLFPSPARLAGADLAALGMPGARALALTSLARAVAADPAIFSRGAGLDEAIANLRALPGIGEWTAQYIALRELREPDAFPAADIGLLRAMADADGRPSVAGRTAGARRSLAALARLCRPASVGGQRRVAGACEEARARSRLIFSLPASFGVRARLSSAAVLQVLFNATSAVPCPSPGSHRTMLRIAWAIRPLPAKSGERLKPTPMRRGPNVRSVNRQTKFSRSR